MAKLECKSCNQILKHSLLSISVGLYSLCTSAYLLLGIQGHGFCLYEWETTKKEKKRKITLIIFFDNIKSKCFTNIYIYYLTHFFFLLFLLFFPSKILPMIEIRKNTGLSNSTRKKNLMLVYLDSKQ